MKGLVPSLGPRDIPVITPEGLEVATLRPLDHMLAESAEVASALTRWRIQHQFNFTTQFPASEARTTSWLRRVLDDDRRLLFLIFDAEARLLGHIGFDGIDDDSD